MLHYCLVHRTWHVTRIEPRKTTPNTEFLGRRRQAHKPESAECKCEARACDQRNAQFLIDQLAYQPAMRRRIDRQRRRVKRCQVPSRLRVKLCLSAQYFFLGSFFFGYVYTQCFFQVVHRSLNRAASAMNWFTLVTSTLPSFFSKSDSAAESSLREVANGRRRPDGSCSLTAVIH